MVITKHWESEYSIIYPFDPTPSVSYAVKELKEYLFRITGATLPEYQDNRHVEEKEIVVGYTNRGGFTEKEKEELGDEGFIIKTEGEKLFIIGSGVRGALYGVYTFLEDYCGCRFYTYAFEKVPTTDTLSVDIPKPDKQIPVFEYRNVYWNALFTAEICAKRKNNGCHSRERFPEHLGGDINYDGGFCHTIAWLTSESGGYDDIWHQPCLTDEKLYQRALGRVRGLLEKNPDARIISISQNDGTAGQCKCEKCKAINDREESEAGTMIYFVNRIAEELAEEYPKCKFDTFAYTYTRKPPKYIRPRDNVVIRLCTIEGCFRHPFEECHEMPGYPNKKESVKEDLLNWCSIAPNLAVWNYTTNFTNCPVMFYNFDAIRQNQRFFAEHNVTSLFEQGNLYSKNGEFGELRGYLLAKLIWNPYMSEEEYRGYMDEFINDFYGAGAPFIKKYLELVRDCSFDSHFNVYFDDATKYVWCRDTEDKLSGKEKFMKLGCELFDKAETAAKDGFSLANIRRSRIQLLDYMDFAMREMREATDDENEKAALTERIIAGNKQRFDYMKRYGVSANREFSDLTSLSEPDYSDYCLRWNRP